MCANYFHSLMQLQGAVAEHPTEGRFLISSALWPARVFPLPVMGLFVA